MFRYGKLETDIALSSYTEDLLLASTTSLSASPTSISSTSTSTEVSPTAFVSILSETLSISTSSAVSSSSTGSKQLGLGNSQNSSMASAAGAAEFSVPPTDVTSEASREYIIIIALISATVLVLLVSLIVYLVRRSRHMCNQRKQELEEGKNEVTEARAMWPVDYTLKEGAYSIRSLSRPPTLRLPPIAARLEAHPLYHPGTQRLRTLPSNRPTIKPLSRPTQSYPTAVNGQTKYLETPPSPFSVRSTLFTTMQTRRQQTPEPLYPIVPFRGSSFENVPSQPIESFWSSSPTSSVAPSSPSTYSPLSATRPRSQTSLRPAPTPRGSAPLIQHSQYQSTTPSFTHPDTHPESVDDNPLYAAARDDSPTLHPTTLPTLRSVRAGVHETPLSPTPPSETLTSPLRSSSPSLSPSSPPRSPESARSRARKYPVLQRLLERSSTISDGAPAEHIDKWLDDSAGIVSLYASPFEDGHDPSSARTGASPLSQALDEEVTSSKEEEEQNTETKRRMLE